ncbi:MAG: stage II sporulation protein M [Kineosporiaceae bacterium]|nr:stage II sporulation protein M [Kineosporiaceae bacterium]MBK7621402.1 stage II sporulation protein M [Kineosporiaceae bacterium]MBK8077441.1 stage II sporulation protein M [Kineosporiaceae bacterium]
MDVDAFAAVHAAEWDRLEALGRRRRLSGAEVDELVDLYQRAATHLSAVRSAGGDPLVVGRLSRIVATGRSALTGGHEPITRELVRLVTVSFPAAVWRSRWWTAGAAAFTVIISLVVGYWVAGNRQAQSALGTDEEIRRLVEVDFERYYSENPATSFAARVWTNNAWVAALCIAFGISGVLVVYLLFQNALNVGVTAGLMAAHDRLGLFFALITPHGLLELTAVFVAAGAGLRLFWAWVDPGPLPRSRSLAREGRSMLTVAMGLVGVLLVSGIVEAFVTPSPLPTWARIAIGAVVWIAFLAYVWHFGRRAAAAGETGDLRADLIEDTLPVAG